MLTVIDSEFDLGDVKKGSLAHHNIKLINSTNLDIVVNPIATSCSSCTSGICKPNPIKANSEANVEVVFNSNKVGMGDMIKSGVISWNVNNLYHSKNFQFKVNVIN